MTCLPLGVDVDGIVLLILLIVSIIVIFRIVDCFGADRVFHNLAPRCHHVEPLAQHVRFNAAIHVVNHTGITRIDFVSTEEKAYHYYQHCHANSHDS